MKQLKYTEAELRLRNAIRTILSAVEVWTKDTPSAPIQPTEPEPETAPKANRCNACGKDITAPIGIAGIRIEFGLCVHVYCIACLFKALGIPLDQESKD